MSKRKALQHEIQEYSSLIRALKTADTLDIAPHLARSTRALDNDHDDRDHEQSQEPPSSSPLTSLPKCRSKRKAVDEPDDRWPLLPSDVFVPEFGFEDEIQLLASQAARFYHPADTDDDDEPLPPALFEEAAAYLSGILTRIAMHIPMTAKSLQDRFAPLEWESILQIVGASDLVDETVLSNAARRLEAMYGTQHVDAVERLRIVNAARRKLDNFLNLYGDSFLDAPLSPPISPSKKPRRKRQKTAEKKVEA